MKLKFCKHYIQTNWNIFFLMPVISIPFHHPTIAQYLYITWTYVLLHTAGVLKWKLNTNNNFMMIYYHTLKATTQLMPLWNQLNFESGSWSLLPAANLPVTNSSIGPLVYAIALEWQYFRISANKHAEHLRILEIIFD